MKENIPLSKKYYISDSIPHVLYEKNVKAGSIPSYALKYQPGIIFEQAYFMDPKDGNYKTRWLTELDDGALQPIYICGWIFCPLGIKNLYEPKMQIFRYIVEVCKWDFRKDQPVKYVEYIETGLDGNELNHKPICGKREERFPHRFTIPKNYISKVNRYLANYFWRNLWSGSPCAAWYCTDRGIVNYLGNSYQVEKADSTDKQCKSLWEDCVKLINGLNGEAVSILLAHMCFSMLKPFFPGYPSLHEDTKYGDGKRNIPKQIAINIQCSNWDDAKNLVDICCGYFTNPKLQKAPIISGIDIQRASLKTLRLSVDKFEKALLQPACILWVNYQPSIELTQSGKILDIHLQSQGETVYPVGSFISEKVVTILTKKLYKMTERMSDGSLEREGCLSRSKGAHRKRGVIPYTLESEYKKRLASLSRYSGPLRSKYISVAQYGSSVSETAEGNVEIEPDLDSSIVEKIAYLSASFRVFAEVTIQSEIESAELCEKVEMDIITAFASQMGCYDPRGILEEHILNLLRNGQCARIRGEISNCDHIRVWYDDRDSKFLISSKGYFEGLKNPGSISKQDFENALVNAGILCTVQRKNQVRRTFETVVQKGGGKLSVLKVNAAALSARFSQSAQKYLEQMKTDETPYRLRRS